jgi:hypothetical protein
VLVKQTYREWQAMGSGYLDTLKLRIVKRLGDGNCMVRYLTAARCTTPYCVPVVCCAYIACSRLDSLQHRAVASEVFGDEMFHPIVRNRAAELLRCVSGMHGSVSVSRCLALYSDNTAAMTLVFITASTHGFKV